MKLLRWVKDAAPFTYGLPYLTLHLLYLSSCMSHIPAAEPISTHNSSYSTAKLKKRYWCADGVKIWGMKFTSNPKTCCHYKCRNSSQINTIENFRTVRDERTITMNHKFKIKVVKINVDDNFCRVRLRWPIMNIPPSRNSHQCLYLCIQRWEKTMTI